jgi:hypothetical protein
MSKPTAEYYEAKANLCRDLAIKQMVEGESAEAGKNLLRMVNALNELNLINYKKGKEDGQDEGVSIRPIRNGGKDND